MKAFLLLFLFCCTLKGAGLGVYNPAQHAVNGFMPTQLPDLQLWLDASKLPFTNGTAVDVWQDFSGKSNWATNGTGSKQPTITTLNGRTALSFDGVDDWMAVAAFRCQTYVSVFCVVKMTSATQKHFFFEHNSTFNVPGFLFYGNNDAPWSFYRDSGSHSCNGIANWNSNTVIVASLTYDGSGIYKRNGSQLSNGTLAGSSRNNSSVTNTFNVFARNGASIFADGRLGELIIFTNKISAASQLFVERYLGTKYGIVVQ